MRLWDVATGKELRRFPAYAPQGSLAFSPDGGLLISNGENSTALIQAVRTGREVMRLRIPSNSIGAAAFSPDGRVAVTGSGDHIARIWDLATGAAIHSLNGHSENVNSVVLFHLMAVPSLREAPMARCDCGMLEPERKRGASIPTRSGSTPPCFPPMVTGF